MKLLVLVVFALSSGLCAARIAEPSCSQFELFEKLLEKSVRFDHKLELQDGKLSLWKTRLEDKLREFETAEVERNKQARDSQDASSKELKELKDELEKTISETQRKVTRWEQNIEEKTKEIGKTLAESLKNHETSLQTIQEAYQTPVVVFSAKCTTSNDVTGGKVIIFTTMITDVGGGYDKNTGIFTAPHDGTYLFHTNICANVSKWIYVYLQTGGKTLQTAGVRDDKVSGTCTSTTGVAILNKGQTAWVRGGHTNADAQYTNGCYSTFSGTLIHSGTV